MSDPRTRLLVQANFLKDANGEIDEATLRQDLIDGADELTRLQSELDEAVKLLEEAQELFEMSEECGKFGTDEYAWLQKTETELTLHRINSRGEQ